MRLHYSFAAFNLVASLSHSASADVITDWNIVAIDAARVLANPNPATRAVAIGHLAAYDAVNAITKSGEPYVPGAIAVTQPASLDAAAIQAFHDALVFAVPAKKTDLDKAAEKALAKLPDGADKTNGIAVGAAAAAALITARTDDGAADVEAYAGEEALGKWRPTPPTNAAANTPQWATLKPFALVALDQFDPGAPPALTSADYAADLLETQTLGAATGSTRTADQTNIAKFWAQQTHLPFYLLARTFAKAKELSVDENARFFGQLSLALADSRVATWHAKYKYGLWRPVTSINSPVDDGNAATTPDPEGDWLPLLETPNHPEYISGHSATGAAGATVLARWFGDDNSFAVTSETLVGAAFTRSFTKFSDAAQENAESRIYGGIHYRFSNEAGLELGEDVAELVLATQLKAFPDGGEGGAGGAGSEGGAAGAGESSGGTGEAGEPSTTGGTSAGTTSGGTSNGGTVAGTSAEGGSPDSGGDGTGGSKGGKAGASSVDESEGDSCSLAGPVGTGSQAALALVGVLAALSLIQRRRRLS
jgi:hypothetical protein